MPGPRPAGGLRYLPYDLLSRASAPCPADAIFVFAGRPERKAYGVELWRRGLAPLLVLSVGRFEWRRLPALGLPSDGGLLDLVAATPPPRRHFLLSLDRDSASCVVIPRGRFGTATEAAALGRLAAERGLGSVLVISSAPHLRRVALSLARVPRPSSTRFVLAAVPDSMCSIGRERWWANREVCALLAKEWLKWALYRILPRRLLVPPGEGLPAGNAPRG